MRGLLCGPGGSPGRCGTHLNCLDIEQWLRARTDLQELPFRDAVQDRNQKGREAAAVSARQSRGTLPSPSSGAPEAQRRQVGPRVWSPPPASILGTSKMQPSLSAALPVWRPGKAGQRVGGSFAALALGPPFRAGVGLLCGCLVTEAPGMRRSSGSQSRSFSETGLDS